MKKRLVGIICVILIIALCGCYNNSGETHRYLIASIGFDRQGTEIKATVEAVAVNSEDDTGKRRIIITGLGDSPENALKQAEEKATAPFNLSHCGMILLSIGLEEADFSQICDYCYNTDEITFSVDMAVTENAEKLLSQKPIASVAVGYDLMSKIGIQDEKRAEKLRNSLYEVVADKSRKNSSISLPFFVISGDYSVLDGFALYKNGEFYGIKTGDSV